MAIVAGYSRANIGFLLLAVLSSGFAITSLADAEDSTSDESRCFSRLASAISPFENYLGTHTSRSTFLQNPEPSFRLSSRAIRFLDFQATVQIVALCNGNFVAVWLPHTYKDPTYLAARVIDATGKPSGSEGSGVIV